MRKILVVPLLIPVIGFAAVKGYYWYQVKTAVDQVVQQVAPFGVLHYDSIVADFSGRAGIAGVQFQPHGAGAELEASAVLVDAESWTWYLRDKQQLSGQPLPARLGVKIEGLAFNVDDLADFEGAVATATELLGCEKAGVGGVPFWKALGYGQLEAHLEAGYQFNPDNGYVTLSVSVDTPTLFGLTLQGSVATGGSQLLANNVALTGRLSELSLSLADDSYNQRRNRYCAGINEESIASFVNRHVDLLDQQYQAQGLKFGTAVVDAYRRFLMTKGVADLRLVAKQPLPLVGLDQAQMDDFDLRMSVNGNAVSPIELSLIPAEQSTAGSGLVKAANEEAGSAPVVAAAEEPAPVNPAPEPSTEGAPSAPAAEAVADSNPYQLTSVKRVAKPRYQTVAVDQLPAYIGNQMQVDTLNGHRIEGTLEAVVRNQLRVKQEFDGGEALLPIRFDLIRSVKVLTP